MLAAGVVGVASLRPGTGPDDVALRVDGVEVTFAEYELRTTATLANRPVVDRLLAGEDFGMPAESVEQMRMIHAVFEPLQADLHEAAGLVAAVVAPAAAYAAALAEGHPPSAEAIADRVEVVNRFEETILTAEDPQLGFPRATTEAQIAALGEERYHEEYQPLMARDALARDLLTDQLDLSSAEAGILPVIMAIRAAEDAEIWIHPSLGVTVEEVRAELDQQARHHEALIALSEQLQADFED